MVGGFPRKAGMERKDAMSNTILRKRVLLKVNCPGSDGLLISARPGHKAVLVQVW